MKQLFLLGLTIGFSLVCRGQALTIDLYTDPADNFVNLLTPTTDQNGTVTIKVNDNSINATLGTTVLAVGGNGYSSGDDLIIDGNGISEIIMESDVAEASASGRTITLTNTGKVHFKNGAFKSSGGNGPITLVIGEDGLSASGVGTLEFDEEPLLNGGIYRIAAGTIIDDVGVTFPAIDENTYSKVKFTTWSSSSTPTPTPTFETYVPNEGDKMISSPTTGGFTSVSAVDGSGSSVLLTKSNLYIYDATDGDWETTPASSIINSAGVGFFGFVGSGNNITGTFLASSPAILSVAGTPNASHTHNLGFTFNIASGASGGGWNLIGNPYPAPIVWSTVSLTNVNNAIYLWDPVDEVYDYAVTGTQPSGTYAGSSITAEIAPMQSFWVQATSTGASISTTSASNTSVKSNPTVYKTMPDNLVIKLGLASDSTEADAFWIKNVSGTTLSFEGAEDAWKYKNPNGPSIYTTDSLNEGLAINSIDLSTQNFVPFTVEPKVTGNYYLDVEQIISNPTAYQIYLLNLDNNSSHDLSNGPATLNLDSGFVYDDSYALFITSTSTIGLEEYKELDWSAFAVTNGIRVEMRYNNVNYELLDVNGKLLGSGQFNQEVTIPTHGNGIRILKVSCADGTAVKKFSILNKE